MLCIQLCQSPDGSAAVCHCTVFVLAPLVTAQSTRRLHWSDLHWVLEDMCLLIDVCAAVHQNTSCRLVNIFYMVRSYWSIQAVKCVIFKSKIKIKIFSNFSVSKNCKIIIFFSNYNLKIFIFLVLGLLFYVFLFFQNW